MDAQDVDSDYVTFDVAGQRYAFPMSRVQEIVRMPKLVRVPLGPYPLEGLANLRGRVLPVVSLRRCVDMEQPAHDEATRVIVVDGGVPLGFVVDRVASVVSAGPQDVEPGETIRSAVRSDVLIGMIKSDGGALTTVLDVDSLIGTRFARLAERHGGRDSSPVTRLAAENDPDAEYDDTLELISFTVEGQEYALPIDGVREIVQAPETVSHVPNSATGVLGVIDLRGRLLPVVSMRRVFGLPVTPLEPQNRIVVVSAGDSAVGVVMDTVREVLRVPHELVAPLPSVVTGDGRASEVESVCRLEDGRRLVSVLSVKAMFDLLSVNAMFDLLGANAMVGSPEVPDEIGGGREEKQEMPVEEDRTDEELFVVFRLGDEEYAVDVDTVQEIIRVPEALIRVPKTYDFVEGLVNLRGTVMPVVDLRTRLGLGRCEPDERQRIVVMIIGGTRTGFVVDSVAEVARVARDVLEPAPELSPEQARVVSRVANLPDQQRMLLLIAPDQLQPDQAQPDRSRSVAGDVLAGV
ncbi:purine-binding chemotaxis protein CheW [Actinoplanes lutulentus]|uniref:Chemotaxis protein CheW n=1 Tax=Actinoplanes lutulentus TaxID=1287878 RepID=A0A327Z724_9ACTN|nr:chemotaxis protein CheW [Actinoplanes lutulentus]MBB2942352.1 purine-binding chemotaxis protein CheW [Actinoplanes lutulentus]RAK33122.1 CheW protein [Actinoplanes lutulentus]